MITGSQVSTLVFGSRSRSSVPAGPMGTGPHSGHTGRFVWFRRRGTNGRVAADARSGVSGCVAGGPPTTGDAPGGHVSHEIGWGRTTVRW